jgi:hypothetical protein
MATVIQQDETVYYSCGRLHLRGVLFRDERSCFHAHVPALDISGYGSSRQEAKQSLRVMMTFYFDRVMRSGHLVEDLLRYGWLTDLPILYPPAFVHAEMRDVFDCIRSGTGIYNISCTVELPPVTEKC